MKLLIESAKDVQVLFEEKGTEKNMYIEGICIQTEIPNGNGRIYRKNWVQNEVNRYIKERVEKNRAWGELGHPPNAGIDHKNVSHRIISLTEHGNDWHCRAIVTNTPAGNIVRGLFESGGSLGISTRGLGSLKPLSELQEVQSDYKIVTAGDIVDENSAPDAVLRAIVESHDWIFNVRTGQWEAQEAQQRVADIVKETRVMSKSQLEENKIRLFQRFINTLVNSK